MRTITPNTEDGLFEDYTESDFVSGSFTTNDPLADFSGLTDISGSLESYSFSDGRNTLTDANSTVNSFSVGTSDGEITSWIIDLSSGTYATGGNSFGDNYKQIYTAGSGFEGGGSELGEGGSGSEGGFSEYGGEGSGFEGEGSEGGGGGSDYGREAECELVAGCNTAYVEDYPTEQVGQVDQNPGTWVIAQSVPEVSATGALAAFGSLLAMMAFLWERRRLVS